MDKKKQSAFEQSLHKINTSSQALYEQSQKVSLPVLQDLFMNALQTFQSNQKAKLQMPQDRAKKGSFNISNLQTGEILKSDGSVEQPQEQDDNSFQSNTQPESPLSLLMSHLTPENDAPQTPTQQMSEDLLHSLDAPKATNIGESYPVEEGAEGQPEEFYAGLKSKTGTGVIDNIKDFLDKRLVDTQNQFQSRDITPQAKRVQLGPMKNSYGAMFNQARPVVSAEPNNQVWQNLFKELQTEDNFYG